MTRGTIATVVVALCLLAGALFVGGCNQRAQVELPVTPETLEALGMTPDTRLTMADLPRVQVAVRKLIATDQREVEAIARERSDRLAAVLDDVDAGTTIGEAELEQREAIVRTFAEITERAVQTFVPGAGVVEGVLGGAGIATTLAAVFGVAGRRKRDLATEEERRQLQVEHERELSRKQQESFNKALRMRQELAGAEAAQGGA